MPAHVLAIKYAIDRLRREVAIGLFARLSGRPSQPPSETIAELQKDGHVVTSFPMATRQRIVHDWQRRRVRALLICRWQFSLKGILNYAVSVIEELEHRLEFVQAVFLRVGATQLLPQNFLSAVDPDVPDML